MTVTIDKKTLDSIKRIAGPRGVSRFLASAAKEKLGRFEILHVLDELNAKYGGSTPAEKARIDREMRQIFGMPRIR